MYDIVIQRVLPFFKRFRKERFPFSLALTALFNKVLLRDMKAELLGWEIGLKRRFKVEKGWTIMDVGANVGQWALWLSEQVGEKGKVIALEPDSGSFSWLTRNLGHRKNVRALKMAAWNENGTIPFELAYDFYHSCIVPASDSKIQTVRIDALVEILGLGVVDAIKVDVEGAEMNVLDGAKRTLERTRLVLIEVHNESELSSLEKALMGFSVEMIDARHILAYK